MTPSGEEIDAVSTTSRSAVGVPTHELVLHDALKKQFGHIAPPGAGRSVFLVAEPKLGFGQPDALLLAVSATGLASFRKQNLRIPSLSAAQSLLQERSSLSGRYEQSLARDLQRQGWSPRTLARAGSLVVDSLAIEAKLSEWRRAIRQASTYRIGAGRAAVLLPANVCQVVDRKNLEAHGIGLMSKEARQISWVAPASRSEISLGHRAWLMELLLRGLDNGSAQRST